MVERSKEIAILRTLLRRHRVVGLIGARQVGKTTLARRLAQAWPGHVEYFDLENPEDQARLAEPLLALKPLRGLVVMDEIQRIPNLFPVLRVLADRPQRLARFLALGSASPELLRQSSESLAGRIVYHEVSGFSLEEVGVANRSRLWIRGGLPRSFLARSAAESHEWRQGFIRTFLERDLPQLGLGLNATAMRRFWTMLAHYHGQIWNASEFARSFGVADTTVRDYLDRLTSAMVVRQLPPWYENVAKRQVKSPKVYIADSGLLHTLLNLRTQADLEAHPKVGASWEGWVLEQVIRRLNAERQECFFWATHAGAELDLLLIVRGKRYGVECKRVDAPRLTPSMRIALEDLQLERIAVVYPGPRRYPLAERVEAVPLSEVAAGLDGLFPT